MRASSYIIYVDLPNNNHEMLLVHGYTGAYDKVSQRVAKYIRSLEIGRPPKPLYGNWSPATPPNTDGIIEPPSDETIHLLRRRGYITDLSVEQEHELLKKFAEAIHRRMSKSPNYMIIPTYNCNLRCGYCFQDHMRTDPAYGHLLRTMTSEVVDRIFTAMIQIETDIHGITPSEKPEKRTIGFFGGEPLLAANRSIIEYIIEKSRAYCQSDFWAVSNATELEAYEDLLSRDMISKIQVTIDGPPAEHDARRIYADGSGSFKKIAANVTMALEKDVIIGLRINVDRGNIKHLPEFAELVQQYKWHQYSHFSINASCIRATRDHVDQSITMDAHELSQMLSEMERQYPATSIIVKPDDDIKTRSRNLFRDPKSASLDLKSSACGAHTGMYLFDSFGDIYACWERTGDPSIRIGNVDERGHLNMNTPMFNLWRSRTVASNPVCSKCRYALHCGGGCAVLAEKKTGIFNMNHCDGFASSFRTSVAQAYIEHLEQCA